MKLLSAPTTQQDVLYHNFKNLENRNSKLEDLLRRQQSKSEALEVNLKNSENKLDEKFVLSDQFSRLVGSISQISTRLNDLESKLSSLSASEYMFKNCVRELKDSVSIGHKITESSVSDINQNVQNAINEFKNRFENEKHEFIKEIVTERKKLELRFAEEQNGNLTLSQKITSLTDKVHLLETQVEILT